MKINKEAKAVLSYIKWVKSDIRHFLGGLSLILLIQVLSSSTNVITAVLSKTIIDSGVSGKLTSAMLAGGAFIFIVFMGMGMNLYSSYLSVRIAEAMSNRMRQNFFKRFMKTYWLELSSYHSGDLITRMTSDIGAVTNVIVNVIPGIVYLGIQLLTAFFVLMHYDIRLGLLAFIMGPTIVVFSRLLGRRLKLLQRKTQESESLYRAYIQESIQNMLIIKCFGLENHSQARLQALHENRMVWILKRNTVSLMTNAILSSGYWLGYLLAFGWGVYGISRKTITFGVMTVFLQLVNQVQAPFQGLAKTIPQIISSMASIDRLRELEVLSPEITSEHIPIAGGVSIEVKNIHFQYKENQTILDNVSAKIKPGEIVALVGPSGEGKTTIVRLLLSLLIPDQGELNLIDRFGKSYTISASTRSLISYVPQGNTLFSGTIAENLRFGNIEATDEEMKEATRDAGIWNFIEELPEGLGTVIGEKGLGLSEGQAQRIAIARAFLRKTPILILDEATSALDGDSEMHVLLSVKRNMNNRICIVITHRTSVLNICTKVLRLKAGALIEETSKLSA